TAFAAGNVPGSLSIWRDGLPSFMGWFLDYDRPVILVDDFNLELGGVVSHFVRLGYDNLAGYLAGGFASWFKAGLEIGKTGTLSVQDLDMGLASGPLFLLDVRDERNRVAHGEIPGTHHIYIGELPARISEVPLDQHVIVYCDAGYKASLAASILARNGYRWVENLLGGFTGWKAAGYTTSPVPG
ncbi:MAG: MBL fold metallo-hydrolase, partial [Methanoregulaceae archaeon]|nr:MBL fold metallo-hydrolase [Methanoregulaceae archaeon]